MYVQLYSGIPLTIRNQKYTCKTQSLCMCSYFTEQTGSSCMRLGSQCYKLTVIYTLVGNYFHFGGARCLPSSGSNQSKNYLPTDIASYPVNLKLHQLNCGSLMCCMCSNVMSCCFIEVSAHVRHCRKHVAVPWSLSIAVSAARRGM
jgi:hypothetical protein